MGRGGGGTCTAAPGGAARWAREQGRTHSQPRPQAQGDHGTRQCATPPPVLIIPGAVPRGLPHPSEEAKHMWNDLKTDTMTEHLKDARAVLPHFTDGETEAQRG